MPTDSKGVWERTVSVRPETARSVKRFLSKYCRPLLVNVQAIRRTLDKWRERQIADRIAPFRQQVGDRWSWTVQGGPLRGLKYPTSSRSDSLLPRLVGSYEAEIHDSIEVALARQPSVLVDIGCEEGYFAVGLALRQPSATLYAYDIDPSAQVWCREMAQLNGVANRVVIDGECTHEKLQRLLGPRGLVLCDCEGFEFELLDPLAIPALRSADLIVELHDHVRTDVDITPTLRTRFAGSHEITIIDRASRNESDYSFLQSLPPEQRPLAMHEPRMRFQQWAFLKSKER
jgi:hypothetical protein